MGDATSHRGTVVILTVLEVEHQAVRAHLANLEQRQHAAGTLFEVGRLTDSPWIIALAEAGEGNQAAAVLAERAISMFEPRRCSSSAWPAD